jgi:beta-glucosidase
MDYLSKMFLRIFPLYLLISCLTFTSNVFSQTLEDKIDNLISKMTLAEKVEQLHQEGSFNTADNPWLGIPGFVMSDGPHGVRNGLATSFPVGMGMAATWDVDLVNRIGEAMGKEFRGKGIDQALGPCLDLTLDPRNGRSPESTSEDAWLNSKINTAIVQGIQSTPTLATIKHFYTEYRQIGRTTNNYSLSDRNLLEQYALQFRDAIQIGGAFSVMSSYNALNGFSAAKNVDLLTDVLRNKWGFPFYVVSDWGSIYSNPGQAVTAGCDLEMGSTLYQDPTTGLYNLVQTSQLSESIINNAVRRVLRTKYLSGLMNYYPQGDPSDVNSVDHQQLTLEAGKKGLVLLKNQDNILPLDTSSITKIAVIGPNADIMQTDGSGSSWVDPFYKISPKEGIENYVSAQRVLYAKGCDISSTTYASDIANALTYASQADVVIFVGGLDASQEGEGFDRVNNSIQLPGKQVDLINMVSGVNPNIIVVLISGGICTATPFIDNIKGLIYGFYPGQEGGNAIGQVLFGDYNPSGKLPVTMPKTDSQMVDRLSNDLNAIYGGGYHWFDRNNLVPQFAFGFGLSYTTFAFSNFQITPQNSAFSTDPISISVDITNTGNMDGEEVAQLYTSISGGTVTHNVKDLKDFKKVFLNKGETKTVNFQITPDKLYYFSEQSNSYEIDPGNYTFYLGNSSDSLLFSHTLQIQKGYSKSDLQIANIYTVPRYPLQGDSVIFLATVINRGTGASPSGTVHNLNFYVNNQIVSYSTEFVGSIPAGGMALICGNVGDNNQNYWIAQQQGTYEIQAVVDANSLIPEIDENNNSKTVSLKVYNTPPINLALNKIVLTSSIESPDYLGGYAVDGNYSTRWSSAFSDPQSLQIDLGEIKHFNEIKIYWETAYGKDYYIDVSSNGTDWNTIVNKANGVGGVEKWIVNSDARYIRLTGTARGTEWGYSIYEFEVYNIDSITTVNSAETKFPADYDLEQNYPNPFNPNTTISYTIPKEGFVTLKVYNILGEEIATLVNEEKKAGGYRIDFNGLNLASGIYIYKISVDNFISSRKMILLK